MLYMYNIYHFFQYSFSTFPPSSACAQVSLVHRLWRYLRLLSFPVASRSATSSSHRQNESGRLGIRKFLAVEFKMSETVEAESHRANTEIATVLLSNVTGKIFGRNAESLKEPDWLPKLQLTDTFTLFWPCSHKSTCENLWWFLPQSFFGHPAFAGSLWQYDLLSTSWNDHSFL